MRTVLLSLPVLVVAALSAGCAQMGSGSSTSAMGASGSSSSSGGQMVMCRDAAWVSQTSQCGDHGGVERVVGTPTQK